jgi:hypothetical protein
MISVQTAANKVFSCTVQFVDVDVSEVAIALVVSFGDS